MIDIGCALLAVAGLVLACKKLEPAYFGKLYCFTAKDAYGYDMVEPFDVAAVHRDGEPVKVCFCYCDELHADTQLFTSDAPIEPSQQWLDRMAHDHSVAVEQCQLVAALLELTNDNCEQVMPMFPTWWETEYEYPCAGLPDPDGPYCTEADPAFGGESDTDTGGLPPVTPDPPVTLTPGEIARPR